MPSHDPEHVAFFIRWWQEILSGFVVIITGLLLKSKGRQDGKVIIPMSEEEIEHRMTICRQQIIIDMHKMFDEHNHRFEKQMQHRDEDFLKKIETLHVRLNREAGL